VVFIDKEGTIVAQYTASDDFMAEKVDQNVRNLVQKVLSNSLSPATAKKAPAKKKKT
jgi:hypothetical protein